MFMHVNMRFPGRIVWLMFMLMVLVMDVWVSVDEGLVDMKVGMSLGQQERNSNRHGD
jgi:hypothetical protein